MTRKAGVRVDADDDSQDYLMEQHSFHNPIALTRLSGESSAAGAATTGSGGSNFVHFEEVTVHRGSRKLNLDSVSGAARRVAEDESDEATRPLMDMEKFTRHHKVKDTPEWKELNKRARKFYETQNEEIEGFCELQRLNEPADPDAQRRIVQENGRIDKIVTYTSTMANAVLLVSLIVAFVFSGAISLIAAVMDAGLDNLSMVLILLTTYMRRKVDRYRYPQGKERLEPVGVMVFSCVMGTSSLLLIIESVQKLANDPNGAPGATPLTLGLIGADIAVKFGLFLLCWRYASRSGAAAALAQDHFNDMLLNSTALVCTFIGSRYWPPLDPIGAICIALYTAHSWGSTAYEQIELLTGVTASPDFLKKLTFVCCNHSKRIKAVDTVRAFRFGTRFLVELDVCLPEDMSLREAHDIGESLQHKIERLEEVERCFVHLDFETTHHPMSEHKVWGQN